MQNYYMNLIFSIVRHDKKWTTWPTTPVAYPILINRSETENMGSQYTTKGHFM